MDRLQSAIIAMTAATKGRGNCITKPQTATMKREQDDTSWSRLPRWIIWKPHVTILSAPETVAQHCFRLSCSIIPSAPALVSQKDVFCHFSSHVLGPDHGHDPDHGPGKIEIRKTTQDPR